MTRINKVTLNRSGFEVADIALDFDPKTREYAVSVIGYYSTYQGQRVGSVTERLFLDRDKARSYANDRFSGLVSKGWKRVR